MPPFARLCHRIASSALAYKKAAFCYISTLFSSLFRFSNTMPAKMRPPKRALTLVIAIVLCICQVSNGEATVAVDPAWINYGQSATITVTFDPPCPGVSIFRRGMDILLPDKCVFGPRCPVNHARPQTIEASVNPNGTWLRFTGVNAIANGRYYASCPLNNATYDAIVSIGVKPRIIAVEFGTPQFGPQINLTRWQGGKIVPWNSPFDDPNVEAIFRTTYPIPIQKGDNYLTVTVGMGLDPRMEAPLATWPKLFIFEAPDFDENSLMKPREKLANFEAFPMYPMATKFRYRLNRNLLVNKNVCSLKSLALASLSSDKRDKATIQLDFISDPVATNLTVKTIAPDEDVPVGHACDCLFTCHAGSCPAIPLPHYEFEWSFPPLDQVSPIYNSAQINGELIQHQQSEALQPVLKLRRDFVRGNVVGFPDQYLLNATACRELVISARDLMRTQQTLSIICRISGGLVPDYRREINVGDIMENSYRDECKTFRRPENAGDGRHE